MNKELDRFLRRCDDLEKVYRGLTNESRRHVDRWWTNEPKPPDDAFGNRLAELRHDVDQYRVKAPRQPRGAPADLRRIWIAEAVAWILIRSGVPLRKSRYGALARSLEVVFDAGGIAGPPDFFPLVSRVAPDVERQALCRR
jgi:hypothetical protein